MIIKNAMLNLEEYDPENVVDTAFTFNGWQF